MNDESAGLKVSRPSAKTRSGHSAHPTQRTLAGLEPHANALLTPQEIRHLYRRAAFAPTVAEVSAALSQPVAQLVEQLLADQAVPAAPGWANNLPYVGTLTTQQQSDYRNWIRELREWWIRLMITQPLSLTEKLTLFWHGHFATQYSTVQVPQFHYKLNALLRRYAMGNFKDMVKAVSIDPCMLYYLDGVRNQASAPNENFAREVMELFTIGIGNYTQPDITNAAKAFTGWTVRGLDAIFSSGRHDNTTKTFMGQTGNFDGNRIIDIIFQQPETARFICRKLYRYFIYEVPDEMIVDQLAATFRTNNYELKPVLRQLFNSAHFYDPLTISAEITSPVERAVGAVRQLGIPVAANSNVVPSYVRASAESFGQSLFEPPNVAGWPGYRQWINTTSLLARNQYTDSIVTGRTLTNQAIGMKVNAVTFAKLFPLPNSAVALVDDIAAHLIPMPISNTRRDMLLQTLLQGIALYDWNVDDPQAPARIEGLLKVIFRMAEYQLG